MTVTQDESAKQIDADVCIIGAGLTGLTAARRLAAAGRSVIVLEAADRCGGRTQSTQLSTGDIVDGGGQWIGSSQTAILALAQELGVQTFPSPQGGRRSIVFRGRLSRYKHVPWTFGLLGVYDLRRAMRRLNRLASAIPLEAPWTAPRAQEFDQMSFADWVSTQCKREASRFLLDRISYLNMGTAPDRISLLYVLFKIRSAGGFAQLVDMKSGGLQFRFVEGAQSLCDLMAKALGSRVHLSQSVQTVSQDVDGVTVTSPRLTVRAQHVLIAMDPIAATRIQYAPALPESRHSLLQHWSMAKGGKIHCVYDRPFWQEQGLSGNCMWEIGHIRAVFDNSRPPSAHGVLVAFTDLFAQEHALLTEDERMQRVLRELTLVFGDAAGSPIAYVEQNWAADPWIGGCVANPPPGVMTAWGAAMRQAEGRIHWASAETASIWESHMDGAVRAGEAEAERIGRLLPPQ